MKQEISFKVYTDSLIAHCWDDLIICDNYRVDGNFLSGAVCDVFGELPYDEAGVLIHPCCVELIKRDNQCVTL